MVELDIIGQKVSAPDGVISRLRELAAAEAGRSNSARDLSLVLERALRTHATVALQRGEARALIELLRPPPSEEFAPLAEAAQRALGHQPL